ncbi:CHY zinc finger protein [uncultured Kocuria sp.]|uniref:CHY zinc finger protein n=1 Tax=uncultured Kocuria sp. TaxID=259305 RepID=UPI002598B101|nr:CHY zinc finger protein [uncultured Kocuria sp.]
MTPVDNFDALSDSDRGPHVYGPVIDDQTRCVHYRTSKDIVALKFVCCGRYFPCYRCHEEVSDHPARQWSLHQRDEPAILCGVCKCELTIASYMASSRCPNCRSEFNERCALHYDLYFEVGDNQPSTADE